MTGERLDEFEEFTLLAVRTRCDDTSAVSIQEYVEQVMARRASMRLWNAIAEGRRS